MRAGWFVAIVFFVSVLIIQVWWLYLGRKIAEAESRIARCNEYLTALRLETAPRGRFVGSERLIGQSPLGEPVRREPKQ